MTSNLLNRRQAIKNGLLVAGGTFASFASLDLCQPNMLMGQDIEIAPKLIRTEKGPFYPKGEIPADRDLTSDPKKTGTADGKVLYLFGRILGPDCKPINKARVEIWQADSNGKYNHPGDSSDKKLDPNFGYFGHVITGSNGLYLFKTIVPASYSFRDLQRAPHIHIGVVNREVGNASTEVYFAGKEDDRIREKDRVFQSRKNPKRLIVPKQDPDDFVSLGVKFDGNSVCCHYDLAFVKKKKK